MKRLLLLTCTIVLFVTQMHAENGTLIVRFENLKSNDGKVMVALFDGKENFSKQEATQTVTLSIANYLLFGIWVSSEGKYIIIAIIEMRIKRLIWE